MSYVTFYAIVTMSGPMVEHINGRRYWNFMELYVWGKSSGTLWNFIMGLMERNIYGVFGVITWDSLSGTPQVGRFRGSTLA